MEKVKSIGKVVAIIIAVFYIVYLLILPNVINLSFVKNMAKDIAKEQAGVLVDVGQIKLLTGFPLKAGASISNVSLRCANGDNALNVENLSAKVNLLPLLFKNIKIDNVELSGLEVSSDISKDGEISLEKCFVFPENTNNSEPAENQTVDFGLAFSKKMPTVKLNKIIFNLKDLETQNVLTLNLNKFLLKDTVLDEKITVFTDGKILLNEKDNITFNIAVNSFLPKLNFENSQNQQVTKQETPYINFIKEFANYDLKADLNADLKLRSKKNEIVADGFVKLDGLTYLIDKKQLPLSSIHTIFDKKQAELTSRIFVSEDENFSLNALLKKDNGLDAEFVTDKISFVNIQKILVALLNSLNIENNIVDFETEGQIVSNIKINTDFKTFISNGIFRISDGKIVSKKDGLYITQIVSDINLENNQLNINKTSALINDALFEIKGHITSDAVADISIGTNKLSLAKLAKIVLTGDLAKAYDVKNGLIDLQLLLKGKLEAIKPAIKLDLSNLEIVDKINKISFLNSKTNVDIQTDTKTFNGNVAVSGTKVTMPDMNINISVPEIKANIDENDILISDSVINFNASKLLLKGSVKNYLQKADINIDLDGKILTSDIKSLFPKEFATMFVAKGSLPLKLNVSGSNDIRILMQVFANKDNYLDFVSIDKLKEKTSLLNAEMLLSGEKFIIKDVGLYSLNLLDLPNGFVQDFSSAKKIMNLSGEILNFSTLKNIYFDIPSSIALSAFGVNATASAEVNINGNIEKPSVKGRIHLTNINAPDYLIKGQLANINLNANALNADVMGLDLNGSVLDAKAVVSNLYANPFTVNDMKLSSPSIDLDKLLVITTKFPQAPTDTSANTAKVSALNTPMIPVNIQKGVADIGHFKLGTIEANSITSDFNLKNDLLKLENIKATAFKGQMQGGIDYNLKTLDMRALLNGENMDADSAVSALIGIKNQIMGTLKFDADIALTGATLEEQLNSLKGVANFEVVDGQLGSLGKIETYLGAANLVSSAFVKSSINAIIDKVLPYNSGQIAKATGKLSFKNGNVYFEPILASGKEMALKVDGYLNMLNYNGKITIWGRLNDEIASLLGPVSEISVEQILSFIPKFGTTAAAVFSSLNTQASDAELESIPALTPEASSKAFKVLINGNTMSASAVKSFQWLSTKEEMNAATSSINQQITTVSTEKVIQDVKTKAEETINEVIKNDEVINTIKMFGDILKSK